MPIWVLPTQPFAASNPVWAAEDIKSARGNITLYVVERFGTSITEMAVAKFAAQLAAARDGAPTCSPKKWGGG